ncbi:MAG: hypothetical protein VR64_20215 [Desulfatitalea sp. BRH_c12]|nr:MAG: hypothetical protein VR64_20215 [Desulfatitalea sp. BRH_c12]
MPVHSIVCIKSVVRTAPDGVGRRTPDNSELNPFDRPALEAALRLKAALGGSVTALSMGPPVSAEVLAEAQAMGVDRAVLICGPALAGSDTLVTARVLAAGIARLMPYDIVFFGTRTSDSDTGQVGPQSATVLAIPFIGGVKQLEPALTDPLADAPTAPGATASHWRLQRLIDGWEESWQVQSPMAVTIHPRAYQARSIALGGIAAAHAPLDIQTWGLADVGMSVDSVGLAGSPTRVSNLRKIKRPRTCRMLTGEPREQVDALIEELTTKGILGS